VTIWGYILEMPGRPKLAQQRIALSALGADVSEFGTVWRDKLDRAKRHATAGQTQLAGRNDLIRAVVRGDRVCVADPMCLGVSPQDAGWFLEQMAEAGVTVAVNGDLFVIEPGADTAEVQSEFARRRNNFNAARSRGRV